MGAQVRATTPNPTTSRDIKLVVQTPPKKGVLDTYVLTFPLGFLGLHHFYLGRHGFGVLYLLTFGLLGVGWLIDWFRVPYLVNITNKRLENPDSACKKDLTDAYVLWFPLGFLGLHHFYLHRPFWGLAYMFTFGFLGIGWLIDGCRMKWLVDDCNRQLELEHEKDGPNHKKLSDAYVLTLVPVTGLLGAQHYYLERYGFGALYTFTLGLLGIGWLIDMCRMPCLVSFVNKSFKEGTSDKKRLDDAYILVFPLGFLGLHHFYLRRYVWGLLYLCTFGLLGIGWIIDWFRLPCLVADYNKRAVESQLITQAIIQYPSPYQSTHNNQGGVNNPAVITTGVIAGIYPPPPAGATTLYPPQQQMPTSNYPQALPYPGYPPVPSGQSSWSTIDSSEVGHKEMADVASEQPPSYNDVTSGDFGQSTGNANAPPLPEKKENI